MLSGWMQWSMRIGLALSGIQLRMRQHDPVRWSGLVRQAVQRRGRAHVEVLLNRDIVFGRGLGYRGAFGG